jgi:disulfide bond formation protein DsbB
VFYLTPDEAGTLFAYLSLIAGISGVAVIGFLLTAKKYQSIDVKLATLRVEHSKEALFFAGFVALFCMMASLYLSDIAHFIPCKLCWYQRIMMYPLAFLLLFAGLRTDFTIRPYGLLLSGIGGLTSIYHYQLQLNPAQHSPFCSAFESCTVQYLQVFGFMSIPLMALMGFTLIFALLLFAKPPTLGGENDSLVADDSASDNSEE